MTLVDSSIWIDHIRMSDAVLAGLIDRRQVLVHPFVIGEIALGAIRTRAAVLAALGELPSSPIASHAEVVHMIEEHRLYGRGVGYVCAHLLAAARLRRATLLWTRDRRLHAIADELGVAARVVH